MSSQSEWFRNYRKYMLSPEWKSFRQQALRKYGKRCDCCRSVNQIQIHHLTYRGYNSGKTRLEEVRPLCWFCHESLKNKEHRATRLTGLTLLNWHKQTCKRNRR